MSGQDPGWKQAVGLRGLQSCWDRLPRRGRLLLGCSCCSGRGPAGRPGLRAHFALLVFQAVGSYRGSRWLAPCCGSCCDFKGCVLWDLVWAEKQTVAYSTRRVLGLDAPQLQGSAVAHQQVVVLLCCLLRLVPEDAHSTL